MGRKILITVFLFLLVGQVVGCTRNLGDMANLSLALKGSNSGQAVGNNVEHIVINVRGPDLPREIFWSWHGDPSHMRPPPQVITMPVPKGDQRLIQVFLVHRDPITGGMTVHYGDTHKHIQNAIEDVYITTFAVSGTGEMADVGGRYINLDGTNPTGILEAFFAPPNGNPSMKIMETSIINGWFKIFLIDGAPLTFQLLHDKSTLFANAQFTNAEFSPTTTTSHLGHLKIPSGYQGDGTGPGTDIFLGPRRAILGYFGPGAGGTGTLPVCYSLGGSVSGLYLGDNTTQMFYAADPTADIFRINTSIGVLPSAAPCSTTASPPSTGPFRDRLILDGLRAGQNADAMFGFRSIFQYFQNNSGNQVVVDRIYDGTNVNLDWQFIPSVIGPNGVDGVSIFAGPKLPFVDDGVDCERLLMDGFHWVGDVTTDLNPAHTTFSFPLDAATEPSTTVAICPFKNNYFGRAKFLFPGVGI